MSAPMNGEAHRRAAVAMLRALGGGEIVLRVSAPIGTLDPRGLGLQQYETSEVRLSSAVVQGAGSSTAKRLDVLLPACEVEDKLGADAATIASSLCAGAVMQWRGALFHVVEFSTEQFAGCDYLYKITLGD